MCALFYWIGRTLQKGIAEYKEDRIIIRQTKEVVDIKTDKALVIMAATKACVDTMMGNHLHTIEGKLLERRELYVPAPPGEVFAVCEAIGGAGGYGSWDWAWEVRGAVDRLAGGVGLRRGRRDPRVLRTGDALDFSVAAPPL